MKKALLALMLVAGSAFAGPRISVGIGFGFGGPVAVARPVCPGPGYGWVEGYYGPSRVCNPGYWRAPVVVAPRYYGYDHDRYEHGRYDRNFRHDFHRY